MVPHHHIGGMHMASWVLVFNQSPSPARFLFWPLEGEMRPPPKSQGRNAEAPPPAYVLTQVMPLKKKKN